MKPSQTRQGASFWENIGHTRSMISSSSAGCVVRVNDTDMASWPSRPISHARTTMSSKVLQMKRMSQERRCAQQHASSSLQYLTCQAAPTCGDAAALPSPELHEAHPAFLSKSGRPSHVFAWTLEDLTSTPPTVYQSSPMSCASNRFIHNDWRQ